MIITAVEPQKKRKDRYNILVDGKFWCGLSGNTLVKYSLYPDKNVDEFSLDDIFRFEIFNKIYNASIGKISRRPHSVWEIENYIENKFWKNKVKRFNGTKYSERFEELRDKTKEMVLQKLEKSKYLNDKDFAEWWINSRKSSRPKGWIAIKSELTSKGVSKEILDSLKFSSKDEISLAEKYYKKVTKTRNLSSKKLISRMSSRGFSWDTIQTILKKYEVEY